MIANRFTTTDISFDIPTYFTPGVKVIVVPHDNRRVEFKPWTWLLKFYFAPIPLRKA